VRFLVPLTLPKLLDMADALGWTPMVAATLAEDTDTLRCLLDAGCYPSPDKHDYVGQPVNMAAIYNRTKCLQLLLESGRSADSDAVAEGTWIFSLGLAVLRGHVGAVRLMLDAGVSPKMSVNEQLPAGALKLTPLILALRERCAAVVWELCSRFSPEELGVDNDCQASVVGHAIQCMPEALHTLAACGWDIGQPPTTGPGSVEPLSLATERPGAEWMVPLLEHHGADMARAGTAHESNPFTLAWGTFRPEVVAAVCRSGRIWQGTGALLCLDTMTSLICTDGRSNFLILLEAALRASPIGSLTELLNTQLLERAVPLISAVMSTYVRNDRIGTSIWLLVRHGADPRRSLVNAGPGVYVSCLEFMCRGGDLTALRACLHAWRGTTDDLLGKPARRGQPTQLGRAMMNGWVYIMHELLHHGASPSPSLPGQAAMATDPSWLSTAMVHCTRSIHDFPATTACSAAMACDRFFALQACRVVIRNRGQRRSTFGAAGSVDESCAHVVFPGLETHSSAVTCSLAIRRAMFRRREALASRTLHPEALAMLIAVGFPRVVREAMRSAPTQEGLGRASQAEATRAALLSWHQGRGAWQGLCDPWGVSQAAGGQSNRPSSGGSGAAAASAAATPAAGHLRPFFGAVSRPSAAVLGADEATPGIFAMVPARPSRR